MAEHPPSRILPHNDAAERALLGTILLDDSAMYEAAIRLRPSHFYRPQHATAFAAMLDLSDAAKPIDYVTVHDQSRAVLARNAEKRGADVPHATVVEIETLMEWAESVPLIIGRGRVDEYIRLILDAAALRSAIEASARIHEAAFAHTGPAADFMEWAESALSEVTGTQLPSYDEPDAIRSAMATMFERMDEARERKGVVGIRTGISGYDDMTGGLQPGQLVILAGRPGMGKTSEGLCWFRHVTLAENQPGVFVSLEMDTPDLLTNQIAAEASVSGKSLRRGDVTDDEFRRIEAAARRIERSPQTILDSTEFSSVRAIRGVARRLHERGRCSVLFVDYLTLLGSPPGLGRNARQDEAVGLNAKLLKELAKELKIPVVVLAQLNRDVEKRGTGAPSKPRLSDLRASGEIEQHADIVVMVHRDYYYTRNAEDKGKAVNIVAKHRNGPVGEIALAFREESFDFRDADDAALDAIETPAAFRRLAEASTNGKHADHYSEPREPLPVPDDTDDDPYTPQF